MHDPQWLLSHKRKAARWAQDVLRAECLILDGETTGTGPRDEFVELAVIDHGGEVLLETRIRPTRRIHPGAARVHGWTAERLADAPGFPEVYPQLAALLDARPVVVYNADFDARILDQTCDLYWLPPVEAEWHCAMRNYAAFHGAWNYERSGFKWHKLTEACRGERIPVAQAHGALADCLLTLQLIQRMAAWLERDAAGEEPDR